MRKLVFDSKNSTLIQPQIRQLSSHRSTKSFIPLCWYIYAD